MPCCSSLQTNRYRGNNHSSDLLVLTRDVPACARLQDVPGVVSVEEMTELLSLHKLCCGRSWHIQGCDARSGMGLHEGLDWLSRQLVAAGVLDVA